MRRKIKREIINEKMKQGMKTWIAKRFMVTNYCSGVNMRTYWPCAPYNLENISIGFLFSCHLIPLHRAASPDCARDKYRCASGGLTPCPLIAPWRVWPSAALPPWAPSLTGEKKPRDLTNTESREIDAVWGSLLRELNFNVISYLFAYIYIYLPFNLSITYETFLSSYLSTSLPIEACLLRKMQVN